MQINSLKVFSDLVEGGSFSKAAKLNKVTQSAVSQQIKVIEKQFNILIIDRGQKQFSLTKEGELLYEYTRKILSLYEAFHNELQEIKMTVNGSIRVATIYSVGLYELPPYIKAFMQLYPAVNISVEYRRSNLVYEDVLQNNADLGIVAFPEDVKHLDMIPFIEDCLIVACSPEHALANKKTISIQNLAQYNLIGFDPDIPTRKFIDEAFAQYGLRVKPVMEFDNIETVKRAIEINAGVGIIPETTIRQEVQEGLLKKVTLKGLIIKRPITIIHRKNHIFTLAAKKLIDCFTDSKVEG